MAQQEAPRSRKGLAVTLFFLLIALVCAVFLVYHDGKTSYASLLGSAKAVVEKSSEFFVPTTPTEEVTDHFEDKIYARILAETGVPVHVKWHDLPPPVKECRFGKNGVFSEADAAAFAGMHGIDTASIRNGSHLPDVRIAFSIDVNSGVKERDVVERARMMPRTKAIVCRDRDRYRPDHIPYGGCEGDTDDGIEPVSIWPWCKPLTESQYILAVDCGVSETGFIVDVITIDTISEVGVLAVNTPRWNVPANHPIQEFDTLAVTGVVVYPYAIGHFVNEIMPQLLVLDRVLPLDVPLLWPIGGMGEIMLNALREENGVSNRTMVALPNPSLIRAKRMFVYRPDRPFDEGPFITALGQRIASIHFSRIIRSRIERMKGPTGLVTMAEKRMHRVLFLNRHDGAARSLANRQELVARVKETLGPDFEVNEIVAGDGENTVWVTAEKVYSSCFIIGPHGANMHNTLYMDTESPCWVVEIGYSDGMQLPTDWYCLPRNLGFRYYLSLASSGSYGSPLTADVEDVVDIAKAYKLHALSTLNTAEND